MFYCQITNQLSQSGEKPSKLVVEKRDMVYHRRIKNEETREWETIEVGRGHEIVKEIDVSEAGLQLWNSWSEEDRGLFVKNLS